MESLDTIFELCKEAGVHEQAVIPVEKIKFSDEVRHLCEVNYCGSYGKTWACPPGVGSVEECREKCMAFTQVYILPHGIRWRIPWIWMGCRKGRRLTKRFVPECVKYLKRILPKRWY